MKKCPRLQNEAWLIAGVHAKTLRPEIHFLSGVKFRFIRSGKFAFIKTREKITGLSPVLLVKQSAPSRLIYNCWSPLLNPNW